MGSQLKLSTDEAAMLLVLIASEKKHAENMMRRAKFFGLDSFFIRINAERLSLLNQLEEKVLAGVA